MNALICRAHVVFVQESKRVELSLRVPLLELGTNLQILTPSGVRLGISLKSFKGVIFSTDELEVPVWMDFDELILFLVEKRKWVHAPKPEEQFLRKRAGS